MVILLEKIYILTYDRPHRKTQDLIFRLMHSGEKIPDLILAIIPWIERKNYKPLYSTKLPPAPICPQHYGLPICEMQSIPKGNYIVIGGAGILSPDLVENNVIINSHCGWLPEVRGLDALKWAIYYDHPIGCTTHVIDAECDKGLLIERQEIELFPTDSLYSIAIRQYELEINMLVDCIIGEKWRKTQSFKEPFCDPTRRMNHVTELQMMFRLKRRLHLL